MANNDTVSNPNDYKVVTFHNSTDFGFTPDMGCMYDGRVINGRQGGPGINAGESMTLPYHIGHRLAVNLAKIVMIRGDKPTLDAQGHPMIKAIWNDVELERLKNSFITELYSEDKPATMSETDILMAKVEEMKKTMDILMAKSETPKEETPVVNSGTVTSTEPVQTEQKAYQDKQEVIAELTKRNIKFDARQNKANLEKLLA